MSSGRWRTKARQTNESAKSWKRYWSESVEDSHLRIQRQVAQAVIDYLKKRPYEEVYHLIAALLQLQPEKEKEDGQRIHHDPE
jgi:hypothetical protein